MSYYFHAGSTAVASWPSFLPAAGLAMGGREHALHSSFVHLKSASFLEELMLDGLFN